ncbi:MAG: hypothetical protein IT173_16145 [Acidobacteria bacterium]|nr:hypothetical protein [Acidobacteriota bacterium]
MKLRIKGNSVRLRLTRPEVERVGRGEMVEERVEFGAGMRTFTYAVEPSSAAESVAATYDGDRLAVILPNRLGADWAATDLVGIENGDGSPAVLVEKDFACTTSRPEEDEREMFPNPAAAD